MITKVVIIKEQAIIIVKVNLRKNMPAVRKIIKDWLLAVMAGHLGLIAASPQVSIEH